MPDASADDLDVRWLSYHQIAAIRRTSARLSTAI
jgi:hypothetical protein